MINVDKGLAPWRGKMTCSGVSGRVRTQTPVFTRVSLLLPSVNACWLPPQCKSLTPGWAPGAKGTRAVNPCEREDVSAEEESRRPLSPLQRGWYLRISWKLITHFLFSISPLGSHSFSWSLGGKGSE